MKKIILTESQISQIRGVLKEQQESVFILKDVDGEIMSLNDDSIEFDLYLSGEDQNGDEVNKTIQLGISLTIEDSEPSSYDHPDSGGGFEWEITSAVQNEPEQKELTEDDIKALYSNSMIINLIEKKVTTAMEEHEGPDNEPQYDPNDEIMESIKKNFKRFL